MTPDFEYYKDIKGWFDFEDVYASMVERCASGGHFVEVGCWLGKSTCFMGLQILKSGKKIKFDAVDIWRVEGNSPDHVYDDDIIAHGGDLSEAFKQHMRLAGVSGVVNPVQMFSVDAAALYGDGSLDFVFLDGNHFYDAVKADAEAWYPKVKAGGFLGGHDYPHPDIRRAIDEFVGGRHAIDNRNASVWLIRK